MLRIHLFEMAPKIQKPSSTSGTKALLRGTTLLQIASKSIQRQLTFNLFNKCDPFFIGSPSRKAKRQTLHTASKKLLSHLRLRGEFSMNNAYYSSSLPF